MGRDRVALVNRLHKCRQLLSMEAAVSLIICTRNRAKQLEAYLASVVKVRCDLLWETVIVDDGSDDQTQNIVGKLR